MVGNEKLTGYRWIILLTSWIATFFSAGNQLFIISIINAIKFDVFSLGLTTGEGALIVILPFVGSVPFAFISGPIVDKVGVKKVGVLGILIYSSFGALRGLSNDFVSLATYTILLGVGLGLNISLASKLIGFWFGKHEIGTANGINHTASGFGIFFFEAISLPVILPLVGNWRNTFFLYGILTAISLFLWIFLIKEYPESRFEEIRKHPPPIREALKTITRNKKVWYMAVIYGTMAISYFVGKNGFRLLFPLRTGENTLFHIFVGEPHVAMFLISFISFGALIANISVPYLSDKLNNRQMFLISSMAILSVSVVFLGVFSGILLWIFAFIYGFGVGMSAPLMPTCIIELVDEKYIATGVGLNYTLSNTTILILSIIFPLLISDKYNPNSYIFLLVSLGILCLIGLIFAIVLPDTAKNKNQLNLQ